MPPAVSEEAVDPAPGSCNCPHQVPHSLGPYLREPALCPPCAIQASIKDIKDIQNGLNARGGIFVSRPRNTKKDMNHPEWKAHMDLRSRWRSVKIELLNDVMRFEQLAQSPDRSEGWEMLDEALQLYEREAENLADVPGYGKELTKDELGEIVKQMMDQLKDALNGALAQDEDGDSTMDDADSEEEAELDVGDCPFPDSDYESDLDTEFPDPSTVQHRIQQMENDENAMDVTEGSQEQKSDVAATADAEEEDDDFAEYPGSDAMETEATANVEGPTTPTNGAASTEKRVRFTEFAQYSPETLNFVPSLFPHNPLGFQVAQEGDLLPVNPYLALDNTPILRKHRRLTGATSKRARSNFRHISGNYNPGRWASPLGYVKADTSCYRMTWSEAEEHWKEEQLEADEEKKAFKQLKAISGTYVLTSILPAALWAYEARTREPPGSSDLVLESTE